MNAFAYSLLAVLGCSCVTYTQPSVDRLAGPWSVEATAINLSHVRCQCWCQSQHDDSLSKLDVTTTTATGYLISTHTAISPTNGTCRIEFPIKRYYFGKDCGSEAIRVESKRQSGHILIFLKEDNGIMTTTVSGEIRVDGNIVWKKIEQSAGAYLERREYAPFKEAQP